MHPSSSIKPLPFWTSLWFFAIPAVLFVVSMYVVQPALRGFGLSEYMSYCWALIIFLVPMLLAALIAYWHEGHSPTWSALKERFRLRPMTRQDWLWTGGLSLFMLAAYTGFLGVGRWMEVQGWIPLPGYMPAMIDPHQSMSIDAMKGLLGGQVKGQWSLIIATLVLLFFNIVGEEFCGVVISCRGRNWHWASTHGWRMAFVGLCFTPLSIGTGWPFCRSAWGLPMWRSTVRIRGPA
jgi:hypothetical protein